MNVRRPEFRPDVVSLSKLAARQGAEPRKSEQAASMPLDSLELVGMPVELYQSAPQPKPFTYQPVQLPNVGAANLVDSQANVLITRAYHELDQAFTQYLGEPPIANWLTFGKYASREAGVQIADLEAMLGAIKLNPRDMIKFTSGLGQYERIVQGFQAVKTTFLQHEIELLESGQFHDMRARLGFGHYVKEQFTKLKDSLVAGNKGVYQHITPAFDTFLKAEAKGDDGVAALKKAGFGKAPLDPQGLILQAFQAYQQAHQMNAKATDPGLSYTERARIQAEREELVARANLLMVTNEQWTIVQSPEVFGDPDIARLTSAMEGTMSIKDANGTLKLLPNGGNWTDFATRMGFDEVPVGSRPNPIRITDEEGQPHDYVPKPHHERDGTIYDYFKMNLGEERSRTMIENAPEPIPGVDGPLLEIPEHLMFNISTNHHFLNVWRNLK